MKIFVSGLTSVETTLSVRGFPVTYYPVDYPFFGIKAEVAGSGFRVANGLLALGDDAELFTLVGDDVNGRRIRDAIGKIGIDTKYTYSTLKNSVESVVLQEMPYGRRQVYCDLKDAQEKDADESAVLDAVKSADLCALLNVNFSRPFISLAHEFGKKIATDVQALSDVNDTFNAQFIENADILFLSDEGISTSPAEFMEKLLYRTRAEVVVMGMGEEGLMYYDRSANAVKTLRAVSRDGIITAGAGAALFSGFLHFYGRFGCEDALKRAEVFAAMKLELNTLTGGFPSESDVERKLAETVF